MAQIQWLCEFLSWDIHVYFHSADCLEDMQIGIHSLILLSVLRQVHTVFESDFCTLCDDLVLPLAIYNILSFH